MINVGGAIALWIILSTYAFIYFLPGGIASTSSFALGLLAFNNLNIFIAICEIVLGTYILFIKEDYKNLRSKFGDGREWEACVQYLTMPLSVRQVFSGEPWAKMWSTYALYDPSYQNHESFGFFIDFGNGLSTIPPSLMMNFAMVCPEKLSPLWVGCIGLAMYWQVMYGTIIYVLSYVFNQRYKGKNILEVSLFVGFSNGLWFFFPILGIYSCVCMLRDGNMEVFRAL